MLAAAACGRIGFDAAAADGGFTGAFAAAEDAAGRVYVTGEYEGAVDFGGGPVAYRGGQDVFLVALDAGGALRWARTFGGAGDEWGFGLAAAGQQVVVAGYYDGMMDLGVPPSRGLKDAYVAAYGLDGAPGWALGFGGPGCDLLASVHGAGGELVVGGGFSGTIDLGDGPRSAVGGMDALVAGLSATGQVTWTVGFGAGGDDVVSAAIGGRATGLFVVGQLGTDLGASDCENYPLAGLGFLTRL